jgi:peptidoglycan/LPS O-acetylase OafA/YrhL
VRVTSTADTRQTTDRTTGARSGQRFPEIQALRLLAVVGVVLYHLWPNRLKGGYVGVDVFFVISGFLITSHLAREFARDGRLRLGRFYARRARRLLPAALLVLAVTAVASWLLLPVRVWGQIFHEIIGVAFYVENWVLAASSVNYLAQNTDVASPVQHYWSLSVEEQFYLVWPLLMMGTAALWFLIRKRSRRSASPVDPRPAFIAVLAVLFVVCFVIGVWQTRHDPAPAYFATQNRAWEFAAGGLLALVYRRTERFVGLRVIASWTGFAVIALTMYFYTSSMAFPGWIAAVPVIGTLLVIAAGDPDTPDAPGMVYRWRPVQWGGDVSYSLYLWHWAPIVLVPYFVGHQLTTKDKLAILVAAVVLAALTKRFVEDPVRIRPFLAKRPARWTAIAAVCALIPVVVFSGGVIHQADVRIAAAQAATQKVLGGDDPCLGAGSSASDCPTVPTSRLLVPTVDAAQSDDVNTKDCWTSSGDSTVRVCGHGPAVGKATLNVALIGDSHSNQYLAAVERIAEVAGWHVDVYGKAGCVWTTAVQQNAPAWVEQCEAWKRGVDANLAARPPYDVIITSYQRQSEFAKPSRGTTEDAIVTGFEQEWSAQTKRGTKVVAIRDNPSTRDDYLDCIDRHVDSDPGSACAVPKSDAMSTADGQIDAAKAVDGASLLDLTRYMCGTTMCKPVIGNVIVYRDDRHLTSTFTRTLAPMIREGVLAATGVTERTAG